MSAVETGHRRAYPARLFDLPERERPRDSLWTRGDWSIVEDAPTVGIVGSRSCTSEGERMARIWARELSSAGIVVVSGLARGIDSAAHRGAIEDDGRTVAVLGHGIDTVYPRAHDLLAREIVERGGAIVSEYPPGIPPAPWRFPARNRIVAALSDALVVVEATERSGSLVTAEWASKIERPIFVPLGAGPSPGAEALVRLDVARVAARPDVVASEILRRRP